MSSPLPSPPPYKRPIGDPEHAPSPTEVATSPAAVKSNDGEHNPQACAIAAVVQRHLPAVLADLRTDHVKRTLEVAREPCIFCGRVEKHLPGCMFQDNKADARCVAELMHRCLPDLLAEQLPALDHVAEEKDLTHTVGEVRSSAENALRSKSQDSKHDPRSRAIFKLIQLHMPAVLAETLPAALERTLPGVLRKVLPEMLPDILPTILRDILPSILPDLLALPTSFTSSYDSSSFDDSPSPPAHGLSNEYNLRPRDLTDLGAALLPHLLTHLQPQLAKMHARSMARGVHYWQKTAFFDLEETAEGYKGELSRLRDDGVEELRAEAKLAVDGVKEEAESVAQDVEDEVCEGVKEEIRRKGDKAVRDVKRAIQAAMEEVEQRGGHKAWHRGWRKVGKGGYRGIGHGRCAAAYNHP